MVVAMCAGDDAVVCRRLVAFSAVETAVWTCLDIEGVSELRSTPTHRVVALFAIRGKTGRDVVRIRCRLVIGEVALDAVVCNSSMTKGCSLPGDGVVACFAVHGETTSDMVGVFRGLVVWCVA